MLEDYTSLNLWLQQGCSADNELMYQTSDGRKFPRNKNSSWTQRKLRIGYVLEKSIEPQNEGQWAEIVPVRSTRFPL